MPRFQISLILLITGLAGFLTSFSLLQIGVLAMWLRYPVAILVAYCVFLLLLRLWLWLHGRTFYFDADNITLDFIPSAAPGHGEHLNFGGGGNFSGGGAGGSWEGSVSPSMESGVGSCPRNFDVDLDLQEGWLIVVAGVALVGGLIASLYIVYIAPSLLAEILVDGVLVTGLYHRVKRIERRHWLGAAFRRTLLPACLSILLFAVAGFGLQRAVPQANSIGEVWATWRQTNR